MKKLLLILLSALALTAFAQVPDWYDDSSRAFNYPTKQYFIGFVQGEKRSNESVEVALTRMKNSARVEAASTIRVYVENTTDISGLSRTLDAMCGTFYQSIEEFSTHTMTSVEMEIPGLQVEAWRNPQTGELAAFAYVKKNTLIRQLEKKITVGLTKIETSLDQVDQMVANGQKLPARELAEKTVPQFKEIDETQKLLAAVDENADEETLQLKETRVLQNRLTGLVAQLKHGLNIFLSCQAAMFGKNYSALKGSIEGELSKMGVTFVPTAEQSDWAIYVKASAREYNIIGAGETAQYVVYVDAKVSIDKTTTGQRVYEEQLPPQKGLWNFSYVEAARRHAYPDITSSIIKIIKEQIQQ